MSRKNLHQKPSTSMYFTIVGDHIAVSDKDDNLISFSAFKDRSDYTKVENITVGGQANNIAKWGSHNNLPEEREQLICDNNIVGELIATKRDLTLGQGIHAYTEKYVDGKKTKTFITMPSEIQDFLDENNWESYAMCAAGEYFKHGNVFTQMVASADKSSIKRIYIKLCKNIRSGKQNDKGFVDNFYWHGAWGVSAHQKDTSVTQAKAQEIAAWINDKPQASSILHIYDKLFFDGYYACPPYWGGKEWIITANNIPKFHQHNLENGYNLRYHIEIPFEYFLDEEKMHAANTDSEKAKVKEEAIDREKVFIDTMNGFLAGVKNSGRAVYTKFKSDTEKQFPGIKITPLSADLKDKALLDLFDKSNDANISAQGIHPVLASIQTQGKLSSGSDIRNAYLLYLAVKAKTPRDMILAPLRKVQKINGWDPKIKFGFEDIIITNLDENPKGINNPTEDEK